MPAPAAPLSATAQALMAPPGPPLPALPAPGMGPEAAVAQQALVPVAEGPPPEENTFVLAQTELTQAAHEVATANPGADQDTSSLAVAKRLIERTSETLGQVRVQLKASRGERLQQSVESVQKAIDSTSASYSSLLRAHAAIAAAYEQLVAAHTAVSEKAAVLVAAAQAQAQAPVAQLAGQGQVDAAAYQQLAAACAAASGSQAYGNLSAGEAAVLAQTYDAALRQRSRVDPTFAAQLQQSAGLLGAAGGNGEMTSEQLQIEQKWVGWVLGKGGMVCREVEAETGAQVRIDQGTKSLGYSIVHITGSHASVQAAKLRVFETLDKVGGRPGLNHTAEFAVEQQWVGLLVGTRGTGIREVESASGAKVSISQETKDLGYSVVRITGSEQQITHASELINKKLELVNPVAASAAIEAVEKVKAARRA